MAVTLVLIPGSTDMSNAANYTGGVGPAAGDSVQIQSGSQTITVGPANTLLNLEFGPQFAGNAAFTVSATGTVRIGSSSGYINLTAGGALIATLESQPRSGEVRIMGAGTVTTLKAYRGSLTVEAAAVVATIFNFGADVDCWVGAGTTTTLHHQSGTTRYRREALTTMNQGGGIFMLMDNGKITTANIVSGMFKHLSVASGTNPLTATITTANLSGDANYSISGAKSSPVPTTININSRNVRVQTRAGSLALDTTTPLTTINNNANATTFSNPESGGGSGGEHVGPDAP